MKQFKKLSFILTFLSFLFFLSINNVSAFCFFGIGTTCDNFNGLSANLRTSYTFDNPFDTGDLWNSAQDDGRNGFIFTSTPLENFSVQGTNSSNFNKKAFNLSAGNVNLTMNIQDNFNMNESFSYSILVKDLNTANQDYLSYCVGDNFSCLDGQFEFSRNGGSLSFLLSNGTNYLVVQTNDFPLGNTTNFYQVGFSYDGSQSASGVRLYYNGQIMNFNIPLDELNNAEPFNQSQISNFFIGRPPFLNSNLYFNYTLDNVLLFSGVVQQNFMENLYNNGKGYSHPPAYPSPLGFSEQYDIGLVTLFGDSSPTAIDGYSLELDRYFKDMRGLHMEFFDSAWNPLPFRNVNIHKNAIDPFGDCSDGNIFLCLSSANNQINLTFNHAEFPSDPYYFDTWYLTAYNGYGYRQAQFNVNSTPFPFPPVIIKNFSTSYNLDNYASWLETENCQSNCRTNLVLKMNDFFSRTIIPARPYSYINVSYENQNIFIPNNANYSCNNGTGSSFVLCSTIVGNDIWLVWYSNDIRASAKVNVIAGNQFGFVNTTFGLVSGGAVYTGQLSGEGNLLSLTGLASFFNALFPQADTISPIARYIYVFIFLLMVIGITLFVTKNNEYGMSLTAVLGTIIFVYFVLIGYISLIIVESIVLIGIGALYLKTRNGTK